MRAMIEQWHLFRFRVDFGKAVAGALAGLHLIALAVFLLTASFASHTLAQRACRAAAPTSWRKLALEIRPRLEAARAEAAGIPNSTSVFWKLRSRALRLHGCWVRCILPTRASPGSTAR